MPGENAKSRMERLAQIGQQQNQSQAGRERTWADVLGRLVPLGHQVAEPLRAAGNTDLYVTGYRNALVVEFGSRPIAVHTHGTGYHADAAIGAALMFMIGADGLVRAYRRPFYADDAARPDYEEVGNFGLPETVSEDDVANSIADFLEWVTTGAGNAGFPLRFF